MATKATINSDKFQQLYHKYDNHNTTLLSCSGLADLVETGDQEKIDNYLKNTLMPYRGVKCVVLGCTHYPLIKENIRKVLGDVKFYDGSVGVSKQTRKILLEKDLNVLLDGVEERKTYICKLNEIYQNGNKFQLWRSCICNCGKYIFAIFTGNTNSIIS